jgi:hypothetical protein
VNAAGLEVVGKELAAIQAALPKDALLAPGAKPEAETLLVLPTDVAVLADVVRLRDRVYEAWDEVRVRARIARRLTRRRSRCYSTTRGSAPPRTASSARAGTAAARGTRCAR